jgi:hypothetical protein
VRLGKAAEGTADVFSIPDVGGLDDLGGAILVVIGLLVIALVVIPLLLFGIELIALALLIAAGIVGRTLLGRPWVVQAVPMQDGAETLTWRVVGWRRSARLIDEVAGSLSSGLRPSPAEGQELRVLDYPET